MISAEEKFRVVKIGELSSDRAVTVTTTLRTSAASDPWQCRQLLVLCGACGE